MATTQSLASITTTSGAGNASGARCRPNGIAAHQQQLVEINIEDFSQARNAQQLKLADVVLESANLSGSSSSSATGSCSSNRTLARPDDYPGSCSEPAGCNRAAAAAAAASITVATTVTPTPAPTPTTAAAAAVALSPLNHDHHYNSSLNQGEPEDAQVRQLPIDHHCDQFLQVRPTDSNNQQQFNLDQLNPDQRRVRRLFATLGLWRPKTEMQPVAPSIATETVLVGGRRVATDHQHDQHQHQHQNHRHAHPLSHHNNHNLHRHHRALGPISMAQQIGSPELGAASPAAMLAPQALPVVRQQGASQQTTSCNNYMVRNPIMFVPTCASNVPFATNIAPITLAGTTGELGAFGEKKLWQSLVMPLVLGCIIFLIAVWTKQISLVLVNETLVMVIILGAVFIIMSGFAFWLAQDQAPPTTSARSSLSSATTDRDNEEDDEDDADGDGDGDGDGGDSGSETGDHAQYQREIALSLHRHYPRLSMARNSQHNHEHCQHGPNRAGSGSHRSHHYHHHHHHQHQHRHRSQANGQSQRHHESERNSSRKCCGPIAIIDCQPPDYHSAMQNSFPVNFYRDQINGGGGDNNNNNNNGTQTDLVRLDIDCDELQMSSPPTYDELMNQNR